MLTTVSEICKVEIRNILILGFVMNLSALPAFSQGASTQLSGSASKNVSGAKTSKTKTYLQAHPMVKNVAVGTGVGTVAGAGVGLLTGKGVGRGAAIGAGTGAGVGVLNASKTLKQHQMIKGTAIGTAAGLGLGLAATRGEGKGKKVAGATAIGAAAGLGTAFLKDKVK
jgi:hypothetical protein